MPSVAQSLFDGLKSVVRAPPPQPTPSLRLLQCNVLARAGREADEDAAAFAARATRNVRSVLAFAPSVCVLEEVDDGAYAAGLRAAGFDLRSEAKRAGQATETVVAWRADALELVACHRVPFTEPAEAGGGEASQFVLACQLRPRCSDVAVPTREFLVMGMHAKAGRTPELERRRVAHAAQLLDWLRVYLATPDGSRCGRRVVWAGDFNAGPHSYGGKYPVGWYDFVAAGAGGGLPSLAFESAMRQAFGEEPALTTCKMRDGALIAQTIDYILFLRGACRVVAHLPMPSEESLVANGCLPNAQWGSDHLPLYCELAFVE